MTILVTGGCGFIGSHLCRALKAAGHTVRVVDDLSTGKRENLVEGHELMEADIANKTTFAKALDGVDAVYHLAAIASVERSQNDWFRAHQVNSGGFVNLMHEIAKTGRKIPVVFASSAAIYGDCQTIPVSESCQPSPLSAYGADKLANEYHGKVAATIHGIPNIGLRFFNVFGPGQDPSSPYSGVISIFMERGAKASSITILGDGQQTRDFVYVGDVVEMLMRSMKALQTNEINYELFNVGTGASITIEQLAEQAVKVTGGKSVIEYGPAREGEVRFSQAEVSKAAKALGFTPATTLADGLHAIFERM